MYCHRNCALEGQELDFGKKAGGFCGICGMAGTIYHIRGTEDYYEQEIAGVLYRVRDGESENTREAVRRRLKAEAELSRARKLMDGWNESHPDYAARELDEFLAVEVEPGQKVKLIAETVEEIDTPIPDDVEVIVTGSSVDVMKVEGVDEEEPEATEEPEKALEDMDEDELRARLKELGG